MEKAQRQIQGNCFSLFGKNGMMEPVKKIVGNLPRGMKVVYSYYAGNEAMYGAQGNREECISECRKLIDGGHYEEDDFYYLNERYLWGKPAFFLEMLFPNKKGIVMAGGNFAYASDSRFDRITGSSQPISIHDRIETQEEYDMYSK